MSAARLKQCETCARQTPAHPVIVSYVVCSLGLTMVCDEPCRNCWTMPVWLRSRPKPEKEQSDER